VTTEEFTCEQCKQFRMANNRQHAKTVSRPCFRYHGTKVYGGSVGEVSRIVSARHGGERSATETLIVTK